MGPGGALSTAAGGIKVRENTNRQDSQMDAFFDFENASGEHG